MYIALESVKELEMKRRKIRSDIVGKNDP